MCIRSVDDEVDPTDLYTESELKEEYDSKHTEPTLLVGMTFDFIFLALPIYWLWINIFRNSSSSDHPRRRSFAEKSSAYTLNGTLDNQDSQDHSFGE